MIKAFSDYLNQDDTYAIILSWTDQEPTPEEVAEVVESAIQERYYAPPISIEPISNTDNNGVFMEFPSDTMALKEQFDKHAENPQSILQGPQIEAILADTQFMLYTSTALALR